MSAPLVTIGIACYNAADTIARAIDSALAQDWPNVEVLIVDDVSTDLHQIDPVSGFGTNLGDIQIGGSEEVNIADCLASCAWCDDVHVLDSGSKDRTIEIARSAGAGTSRRS